jgi:hypothetical protein
MMNENALMNHFDLDSHPEMYRDYSRIDLLFEHAPPVESLRQWIVLVCCWILMALFAYAIFKLYKT